MPGSRRWARACLSALIATALASPVTAQIGAGALAGDVVDQASARVPGATVTIVAVGTGLTRTAVTGEDGSYLVPGLPPGSYQIRVESTGFRRLTRDGIKLATGETVRLNLQLELGAINEAVTVTADAPLLRSETSGLGHVIDNRKVVDLPLNGRSVITLASLAPGVVVPPPPRLRSRASTADDRAPTNIPSTGFRCCSPSLDRSPSFRTSTRFRSSKSKATARLPRGPVVAVIAAGFAAACVNTPAGLTQLLDARRLASELHVEFTRASDAANRAGHRRSLGRLGR